MNNELYIWYYTESRGIESIPLASKIWLTESLDFDTPSPLEGNWMKYNPYKDDFPPSEGLKLPSNLNLIIDVDSEPCFDCIFIQHRILAVSETFLEFLKINDLDKQIEVGELNVYDKKGNLFSKKRYFAVRVGKFNDELFDFDQITKKRAAGIKDFFLYPNIKLIKPIEKQNIFFLLEFCYNDCLVLTEEAKNYVLQNFYMPEIYGAKVFNIAYNNQTDKAKLPEIEKL